MQWLVILRLTVDLTLATAKFRAFCSTNSLLMSGEGALSFVGAAIVLFRCSCSR